MLALHHGAMPSARRFHYCLSYLHANFVQLPYCIDRDHVEKYYMSQV